MTIWLDAQFSPRLARWIAETYGISAVALRDVGLRDSEDEDIFLAARKASTIVITKDSDFVRLLEDRGSPPKVIWITCGNSSDAALRQILASHLSEALLLLESGEDLVEIGPA